jgi:hypothetical protein
MLPFLRIVLSPNNSFPPSIIPFPFISRTSKPSSESSHAVLFINPFPSKSKYVSDPITLVVSMPSPSKSRTNGSLLKERTELSPIADMYFMYAIFESPFPDI